MSFPIIRPRRLRNSDTIRRMVRETRFSVDNLIMPLFVIEGKNIKEEISSMPGIYRFSIDNLQREIKELRDLDIPAVLIFGIPKHKDAVGSEAYSPQGIVQKAIQEIKNYDSRILVITDVCLCEYTDHGHCGIIKNNTIDNDTTLEFLCKTALSHAETGADIIAPSDMMDGRIQAIRGTLDKSGYINTLIMAYSVKFASAFYGPFREAAESTPKFGNRSAYQMDYCNARESLKESQLDIAEGADIIMVKPALAYLDLIFRIRQISNIPLAAYNVSGEYSMVKAAAANQWLDETNIILECLTSIKRAGADIIITYFAKEAAKIIT